MVSFRTGTDNGEHESLIGNPRSVDDNDCLAVCGQGIVFNISVNEVIIPATMQPRGEREGKGKGSSLFIDGHRLTDGHQMGNQMPLHSW